LHFIKQSELFSSHKCYVARLYILIPIFFSRVIKAREKKKRDRESKRVMLSLFLSMSIYLLKTLNTFEQQIVGRDFFIRYQNPTDKKKLLFLLSKLRVAAAAAVKKV